VKGATGPGGGDAEQAGEHGPQVSVARRCKLVRGARAFRDFIRAHRRVMICAAASATLRIARLARADSQVGLPALRIVLPGCSIRDPGRWVCRFAGMAPPAV